MSVLPFYGLLSNHAIFIWKVLYFLPTVTALYVGLRLKVGLYMGNGVI